MTVPVYLAEVSPPHQRGLLVTINSLFITGGQFIASVVDGAFSYLSHDGWRYVLVLHYTYLVSNFPCHGITLVLFTLQFLFLCLI